MINKVRGTQDILDMRVFDFLIKKVSDYLNIYNFTSKISLVLKLIKFCLGIFINIAFQL